MNIKRGLSSAAIVFSLALAPAAAVCPVANVYVDDDNCPALGSGTALDPYCSLQNAYDVANAGNTILVAEGIYNECVFAWGFSGGIDKPVTILAEPWCNDAVRDNTRTTLTGEGLCDGTGLTSEGSTLAIGGTGARVEGFTISGGGSSGIFAQGSVVITNNVITGNRSTLGGGVYVYSANCYYSGDVNIEISNNVITNNAARDESTFGAGDGGGLYVLASSPAPFPGCPSGNTEVLVHNNRIEDNSILNADIATGGGLHVETATDAGTSARIVVTNNLIRNNGAEPGSIAYGGGMWAGLFGTGTETIEIRDNTVEDNDTTVDGGGISAWTLPIVQADHTLVLEGNTIRNNEAAQSGGGLDLFANVDRLTSGNRVSVSVTDNEITDNGAGFDGGGILAEFTALRASAGPGPSQADAMEFRIDNNRVVGNATLLGGGGGVFLQALADADPDSVPPGLCDVTARAAVEIGFTGNLVANNEAGGDGNFSGGGVLAFLDSRGDAEVRFDVGHSTFASNDILTGFVGGIEVDAIEDPDCTLSATGQSFLDMDASVIAGNDGFGIGGPGAAGPGTPPETDVTLTVCDVFGNTNGNYENAFFQNATGGNVSVDPRLDPVTFVPAACSAVYDLGSSGAGFVSDPDISADGSVDGIDVIDLALSFDASTHDPNNPGDDDPRFDAAADLDRNGSVDGRDLSYLAAEFAEICP